MSKVIKAKIVEPDSRLIRIEIKISAKTHGEISYGELLDRIHDGMYKLVPGRNNPNNEWDWDTALFGNVVRFEV